MSIIIINLIIDFVLATIFVCAERRLLGLSMDPDVVQLNIILGWLMIYLIRTSLIPYLDRNKCKKHKE